MITAMATAIGAVGPEICDRVPPNTAAKNPTAIAPYRPAAAPNPDATPKASETGSATTAEVRPPKRSPRSVSRSYFTGYTVAIRNVKRITQPARAVGNRRRTSRFSKS